MYSECQPHDRRGQRGIRQVCAIVDDSIDRLIVRVGVRYKLRGNWALQSTYGRWPTTRGDRRGGDRLIEGEFGIYG